jgi:predicted nucleic acid binding AN1-type Zn finger protein
MPTPSPVEVPIISQPELKKEEEEPMKEEAIQVDKKKCFACKKKVGLLGTECKCSFVYCNAHRLPESHSCSFDFRAKGQK